MTIAISANEAKTQGEELMQQRTMSHVEQLGTKSHRGKAKAREPRGRSPTEAAEVRHAQSANKQQARLVRTSRRSNKNNENDNEPRRTALIMMPTRESDGAPSPRTKLNGSSRSAIYANRSSRPASYTHTDLELQANQRQAAPSTDNAGAEHMKRA